MTLQLKITNGMSESERYLHFKGSTRLCRVVVLSIVENVFLIHLRHIKPLGVDTFSELVFFNY